jgi:magnesium chelatase family protein
VKYKELRGNGTTEESAVIRDRVLRAREGQSKRDAGERKVFSNAQMPPKLIRKFCAISEEGEKMLENGIGRLGLSARAHDRILKVGRTIADLDVSENLETRHLGEAIQYRTLGRTYWAQTSTATLGCAVLYTAHKDCSKILEIANPAHPRVAVLRTGA